MRAHAGDPQGSTLCTCGADENAWVSCQRAAGGMSVGGAGLNVAGAANICRGEAHGCGEHPSHAPDAQRAADRSCRKVDPSGVCA